MRQTAKVFRWLLEIVAAGRVKWAVTPGAANTFVDWASRNPAERGLIIPVEEPDADPEAGDGHAPEEELDEANLTNSASICL